MPESEPPVPADDGAALQKVLIGGVLLLLAGTLVGMAVVFTSPRKPPVTETPYVPFPADAAPPTKR